MLKILAMIGLLTTNSSVPTHELREINPNDIKCIATAIYHEARGEPIMGQVAVAHVILNRVGHPWYADNICGVVYQPHHFTDIHKARPDEKSLAWERAVEHATLSYIGFLDDPTDGSIMYHNPRTAPKPNWDFRKIRIAGNIGQHRFYKEK